MTADARTRNSAATAETAARNDEPRLASPCMAPIIQGVGPACNIGPTGASARAPAGPARGPDLQCAEPVSSGLEGAAKMAVPGGIAYPRGQERDQGCDSVPLLQDC